jgi:hypothetical protein
MLVFAFCEDELQPICSRRASSLRGCRRP